MTVLKDEPQPPKTIKVVVRHETIRGTEYQYYQEFPTDQAFYEVFAKRRGLSAWQVERIRRTLTDYNRDLWTLIAPDPVTGQPSSRSPDYARQELRSIYGELLKGIVLGSAVITVAGAGLAATNATAARGTTGNSVTPGRQLSDVPDWVSQAVRSTDLIQEFQRLMRVAP